MSQSISESVHLSTGLENSTYNMISSLGQEPTFLYKTVHAYIEEAKSEIDRSRKMEYIEDHKGGQKERCQNP
jgi:hypothetical protein